MRKGLHPLTVQIGLAASAPEASRVADNEFLLRPEAEITEAMRRMLLGIQKYQNHPYEAKRPPLEKIWEAGTASIQAIPGYAVKDEQEVILLVPSMVNRGYILDLTPERSMLRWLSEQGITAYLLDWGEGVLDARQQSIEDIVLQRLVPAIDFVAQKTGKKPHILGYCMGGTLVAGAAQNAAQNIASLIFLAAPWDFHAGTKNVLNRVKFWSPSAFPAIQQKGVLPMDWMQTLFASVEPKSIGKKFGKFLEMEEGSDEEQLFVAVEDWLNDGVDLPGPIAQQCIKEWFFENAPAAQKWVVSGKAVNPVGFDIPTLVITSKKDRLVDYDTAAALGKSIKGAKVINTNTGHIGMIAGSAAVTKVWEPIAKWVKSHG